MVFLQQTTVMIQTQRMLPMLEIVIKMVFDNRDCDDFDGASTTVATDGDCDGVLTADDCDEPIQQTLRMLATVIKTGG